MSTKKQAKTGKVYYKILRKDMHGPYAYNKGSTFKYVPRRWLKIEGALVMCKNGFHVCTSLENARQWVKYIFRTLDSYLQLRVYECQIGEEKLYANTTGRMPPKIVASKIRLLRLSPHFSRPRSKKS